MVTAELPETPQLETLSAHSEAEVLPDVSAPAEPTTSTEAQGTEQVGPIDHGALMEEFAKEQGYSTETTEVQDSAQVSAEREAGREEGRREAQEAFNKQTRDAGVSIAFSARTRNIYGFLTDRGISPEDAQRVTNEFNAHHAQSAPVHFQIWGGNLNSAVASKLLPEKERQAWLADVAKAENAEQHAEKIAAAARKGYVTEAERDKAVQAAEGSAMAKYKAFLERKGVKIGGSQTPPKDSGNGASAGMGWRTKEEARNLHAQGKLTNAKMREINADPTIPEGYGR